MFMMMTMMMFHCSVSRTDITDFLIISFYGLAIFLFFILILVIEYMRAD